MQPRPRILLVYPIMLSHLSTMARLTRRQWHALRHLSFVCGTTYHLPILAESRSLDEDILRPFHYSHRSWKDGAVALRHDLLVISEKWNQLGFTGSCPVLVPEPGKISIHKKHYRHFEAAQKLRKQAANILGVSSEGWVPEEAWERTQLAHEELFRDVLKSIVDAEATDENEPVQNEEDLRAI